MFQNIKYSPSILEGLVIFNPSNNGVLPGVASEWNISEDGLTYTFVFNPDAKWTNGESVKPEHFVYSWERILSPAGSSICRHALCHKKC